MTKKISMREKLRGRAPPPTPAPKPKKKRIKKDSAFFDYPEEEEVLDEEIVRAVYADEEEYVQIMPQPEPHHARSTPFPDRPTPRGPLVDIIRQQAQNIYAEAAGRAVAAALQTTQTRPNLPPSEVCRFVRRETRMERYPVNNLNAYSVRIDDRDIPNSNRFITREREIVTLTIEGRGTVREILTEALRQAERDDNGRW